MPILEHVAQWIQEGEMRGRTENEQVQLSYTIHGLDISLFRDGDKLYRSLHGGYLDPEDVPQLKKFLVKGIEVLKDK